LKKELEATIWSWGEEFEDVGKNCEKYISKRWDENIKECGVWILARERNEGIIYNVVLFVSDPKNISDLAQRLFYATLFQGNTKIDFVLARLSDSISASRISCHDSMETVERELKKLGEKVIEKFSGDPKIRQMMIGREVVFIPEIDLLCELESQLTNKIVVEVIHDFFPHIRDLLDSLTSRLIKEGLAKRVLGYKLEGGVNDLKVEDTEVRGKKVFVWLTRTRKVTD